MNNLGPQLLLASVAALCQSTNLSLPHTPSCSLVAAAWSCSEDRKRSKTKMSSSSSMEKGQGGAHQLESAPSGKGDRFFTNIVPSFLRRD